MVRAKAVLLACAVCSLARGSDYTALDRYVAAPDASYRYSLAGTTSLPGVSAYQLEMVSQTWMTTSEVNRTEWHHWVTIYRPDFIKTNTVLLYIDGGDNSPTRPDTNILLYYAALTANAIVVDLGQVPNQPLTFVGETNSRSEDAIIAYSWDRYLRTGDERWPLRLPMTKAAVRAMDTVTDFLGKLSSNPIAVKNYVVAGASKRGWTTWSVAEVDPRVVAIAPIVIDLLNIPSSFQNHWRAYGLWSSAVQDYVAMGIMNWFGTPQMEALLEIEDPYRYRARFQLPSFQLNSSGDQFFLPDSPRFYFSDLPGEKYLRFAPNTDHSMQSLEAISNLVTWFGAVTQNVPRPRFYWTADRAAGKLTVRTIDTPTQVLLWQATNPKARDFRLETIGPVWTSTPLSGTNGVYTATVTPGPGWTASFVELRFPGLGPTASDSPFVFTTEVLVTPDTYPFDVPTGWGSGSANAAVAAPGRPLQ